MKALDSKTRPAVARTSLSFRVALAIALLAGRAEAALAAPPPTASVRTNSSVEAVALKWFDSMQTGQIDRTQLSADYNAQLTDQAVQGMSRYLKDHDYGVSPKRAEVLQTRTVGEQTFYVVKLLFARGDAGSLLLGFDAQGKISAITLLSMAGD